jgi:hypothetical protein
MAYGVGCQLHGSHPVSVVSRGFHMGHMAPMWGITAPMQHDAPKWHHTLPFDAHSSHLMHSASIQCHSPPIWQHTAPYSAYSSHLMPYASNMVHTGSPPCGPHTAHVAPAKLMWLPYGTCGLHRTPSTLYMAQYGSQIEKVTPIMWLTLGSRSAHGSHTVPVCCMWLPYGTSSSHTEPAAPTW